MSAFRWDDDPREIAGASLVLEVVAGVKRYADVRELLPADERLHWVAQTAGDVWRLGHQPTPALLARALEHQGHPTRGALAWLRMVWREDLLDELRREGLLEEAG